LKKSVLIHVTTGEKRPSTLNTVVKHRDYLNEEHNEDRIEYTEYEGTVLDILEEVGGEKVKNVLLQASKI
jgi:hypothetical protein